MNRYGHSSFFQMFKEGQKRALALIAPFFLPFLLCSTQAQLGLTEKAIAESYGKPIEVHPIYMKFYKSTLSANREKTALHKKGGLEIIAIYYPGKDDGLLVGEIVYKFPKGLEANVLQAKMDELIKANLPGQKEPVEFQPKGKSIKTLKLEHHIIQYKEFLNTLRITHRAFLEYAMPRLSKAELQHLNELNEL